MHDARNHPIFDWGPDYIQSGDDRHVEGPKVDISQNEQIIGVFGQKVD